MPQRLASRLSTPVNRVHRRRVAAAVALTVTGFALATALSGCGMSSGGSHWRRAAAGLDKVARHVDEYGTVTVSEPLLLSNTGQFKIDYEKPAGDYVSSALTGVQAAARRAEEPASDVPLGLRAPPGTSNPSRPPPALPATPSAD